MNKSETCPAFPVVRESGTGSFHENDFPLPQVAQELNHGRFRFPVMELMGLRERSYDFLHRIPPVNQVPDLAAQGI
jgi:hypothetical protein